MQIRSWSRHHSYLSRQGGLRASGGSDTVGEWSTRATSSTTTRRSTTRSSTATRTSTSHPTPGWDGCRRSSRTARRRWSTATRATTGRSTTARASGPVGLTATAGLSFLDFAPVGVSYESMRPGKLRHQGAPRRHGHRRDVPPGAVPERDPARRQDLRLRARAPGRVRPRLQRLAGRVLRRLRRSSHRPGHPADDRRRRHGRRDEALPRPRPPRRGDLGVPERLARPRGRGRARSGRSRRRPTRRWRCTSAASCRRRARRAPVRR